MLAVKIIICFIAEKKSSAKKFTDAANIFDVEHYFADVRDLTECQGECLNHDMRCEVEEIDFLAAGTPCQDFSVLNSNRFQRSQETFSELEEPARLS